MGTIVRVLVLQLLSIAVCAAKYETGKQKRVLFGNFPAFTCPKLTSVVHGTLKCTHGNTLTSTCTTTCASGFTPVHPTITCTYHADQKKSIWSATPSCKAVRCPSPPTVSHGALHCPSSTHAIGQVCTLACTTGYRFTSSITAYHSIRCLSNGAWSTHTTCTEIRCPAPSRISHGSYHCSSLAVHKYGQKCNLTCSAGFKPSSSAHSITCLASSKWSASASCVEIRCPTPPKVTAGSYQCSSTTTHKLNDVCHLKCNAGSKPSTKQSDIKCLSTSAWSTPTKCVEIRCPTPPKVTAGSYKCTSVTIHKLNDVCRLHCNAGYKPSTTRSDIKCLSTSAWSTPAKCVEIICPPPAKVAHGAYWCGSATTHKLNDVCNLHCNPGYRPSTTSSDIHCLTTDAWSTAATCVEIRCPTPATPQHGTFHCSPATAHTVGSTCGLTCSPGYLPSVHTISCLSDSTWSASPVCTATRCPTPKAPQHGSYSCDTSPTSHKPADTCRLTCASGYTPSVHTITCLADTTWTAVPSCTKIRCPRPAAVPHGSYTCHSGSVHSQGDTCTLTCATGYRPSTPTHTITCRPDATWTSPAICVEIRCTAPPRVTGGAYKCASATIYQMNDVCHLECNTAYKPSTSQSDITCLSNMTWSSPSTCAEILCPTPPKVNHGTYVCASTTVHRQDDVCHLRCSSGYKPSSTTSDVRCQLGAWSAGVPCVEIRCPSPPAAAHGSLNCSSADHEVGSTCNLTCTEGYQPSVHTITCLPDATWSEPISCRGIRCPRLSAVSHGSFRCSSETSTVGSTCRLTCVAGYQPSVHTISCLADATWSQQASCIRPGCANPVPVNHGTFNCTSSVHVTGSICHLSCATGYRPSVHSITCLQDSSWSEAPSCIGIRCPAPAAVPGGTLNCSSTTEHRPGDRCQLTCATGYTPNIRTISCLSDATWSSRQTCVDSHCPSPPIIQHGMFRCSSTNGHYHGDTCDLLCDRGHRPSSFFQVINCRSDNTWSPSAICVEITCPSPLPVTHGSLNCSAMTTHKEGDTCRLSCDEDYQPSVHTITCLADATWSNTALCNEIVCSPPSVTPHGSFNCSSSLTHKLGDTCALSCVNGYRPHVHTISCLPDSTWSDSTFCVDDTPPVIHCPVGQTIALLPNETGTNITWPQVTATDFPSGVAIPATLTSSVRPGSNVTAGAYTVTYASVDEAGNRAKPCTFLVIVSSSCPQGSYLSVTQRQCRPCPVGTYQQHENSLSCVACPDGFSTSSEGSSSLSSCRGTCGAGSYSSDGLEPCSLCPLGTYQSMPGSTQCDHCPQGQTTHEGAKYKQDCSQSLT
ncbi:sushi, von Willebrand factor type A, EGF and pentraxin domain-containing protein 1-like [Haliotis asinina]|uniref:sushi, von Willebrand factor type A, EGF and pentraxin domain-containing protein 1-like n=1 Tax=Haliotis asinina TaxID=109174 RepID=UPI0035319AE8